MENILIKHKSLIGQILNKHISVNRVYTYQTIIQGVIKLINENISITENELIKISNLEGKIVIGEAVTTDSNFSDDVKSATFINKALKTSIKCNICNGYLDVQKSVSYDHIIRKREGGLGSSDNCDLTHPYCNQSTKN